MDQAVHERQKAISRQFIEIADIIAKRLGLETRLHLLNIENLEEPMCDVGVYTPTGIKIGVVDVRLNVADCKAKVTCALFRDLEDDMDDWTFLLGSELRQEPDVGERRPDIKLHTSPHLSPLVPPPNLPTASTKSRSPQSLCIECGNQVEDAYNGKRELCATCYAKLMKDEDPPPQFVSRMMLCLNPACAFTKWESGRDHNELCPLCYQRGKVMGNMGSEELSTIAESKVKGRKPVRFRCDNPECSSGHGVWTTEGDNTAMCPTCAQPGTELEPDQKSNRMRCTNLGCTTREWDGGGHEVELCPGCRERGSPVEDDRRTSA